MMEVHEICSTRGEATIQTIRYTHPGRIPQSQPAVIYTPLTDHFMLMWESPLTPADHALIKAALADIDMRRAAAEV